jgi:hypothetical protein
MCISDEIEKCPSAKSQHYLSHFRFSLNKIIMLTLKVGVVLHGSPLHPQLAGAFFLPSRLYIFLKKAILLASAF